MTLDAHRGAFETTESSGAFRLEPATEGKWDLQEAILDAYRAGHREIVIPPGRYRLEPKDKVHLALRNLEDLTIVGYGVEIICTETTRAVHIEDCKNLHITGFTIYYDPLPFTQGWITDMAPDKSWLEIEIIEGYPKEGLLGNKLEVFDPETKLLCTETYYGFTVKRLDDGRFRLVRRDSYRYNPLYYRERVGDIAVVEVGSAPGGSLSHAVYILNSEQIKVEGITVYASPTFAFCERTCHSRFLGCVVDRRPVADDPVERGYMRLRSANGDAFHSWYPTRGPIVEKCLARFMGDDAVNITGKYHYVAACQGNRLRVVANNTLDVEPGDRLEIMTYEGKRLSAVVESIEPAEGLSAEERVFGGAVYPSVLSRPVFD